MSFTPSQHPKPEALAQEAMQTVHGQAALLRQWADLLDTPGLTTEQHEVIMLEVKMSAAWLTVALNQRLRAEQERKALRPWQDIFNQGVAQ